MKEPVLRHQDPQEQEVKEVEKKQKWRVVSEYFGKGEFDSLPELLEALETQGVNTDVLREGMKNGRRVLRSRAYNDLYQGYTIEAFHEDFEYKAWYRNPSWETVAETLEGEEEEE